MLKYVCIIIMITLTIIIIGLWNIRTYLKV